MVVHIISIAAPNATIVDFCAGGGHLGIVVAYLRPDCKVVLVENKEESIERACKRVADLGLSNVSAHLTNLNYFDGHFDVGVTLHACGSATDLVLRSCLRKRASFVICPCCYGSVRSTSTIDYPQSQRFQQVVTSDDFQTLAHATDQTNSLSDPTSEQLEYSRQGKLCMNLVDLDRIGAAKDAGYSVCSLRTMKPETCSPKNNLITGYFCDS